MGGYRFLIFASRNAHKVAEVEQILGFDLELLPDDVESPPEDAETFAGNALIKARSAREATGQAVIADDSGIEVDSLDGRPGVRSARYAGEDATDGDNLAKVLGELAANGGDPGARYVCAIAYIDDAGEEHLFEGTCAGRLVQDIRGTGGFGYDPAFIPDETGPADERTMAEITSDEKHAISHRGKAVRDLARHLGLQPYL
ncbi:MAG: RdgB/HAM1 family non-canonical purine NTP pyrophosphatase [Solirubrobacterales bacterium]|nr:RdgB/HAM1 family non-canonical purine NTP pyrophosphatase [Solirubrobacterales bacterium]